MPNAPGPKKLPPAEHGRQKPPGSRWAWLPSWLQRILLSVFDSALIRRIAANSGYLFSATGIAAILGIGQNILAGRLLGVQGWGLLATIILFTSVVNKFASFRMSELVIKYVGKFSEEKDEEGAAAVFKAAALAEIGASLFAFTLVVVLSPLAARYLAKDPATTGWFMLYGLIILANLIAESSTGLLQIYNRYPQIAIANVVGSAVTLAITAVVFIAFESGQANLATAPLTQGQAMPYVLFAYVIGKICGASTLTVQALHTAGKNLGSGWWTAPLKKLQSDSRELVHFAVSTNISATLSLVNKDAEILWVSLFRSTTEAGYYKTALSLINLVTMPVSPLPQATYPELSRAAANKNWQSMVDTLKRSSLLAGGFTLGISVVLALFGQQLILLLYNNPDFLPAYPALLILIPGFLMANTFFWNRIALLALGKPDFPTKLNLVLAICKMLGILLLVPRFGYLANAALLSASYLIGVSIAAWKTRSVLRRYKAESCEGDNANYVRTPTFARLRIGYVLPSLGKRAGWRTHTLGLLQTLSLYSELEPVLFVAESDEVEARRLFPEREIYSLPCTQSSWLSNPRGLSSLLACWLAIRKGKYPVLDLVHSFEAYPTGLVGHWLSRRAGCKHILTAHGTYGIAASQHKMDKLAYRAVLRQAEAICPVSNGTAAQMQRLFGKELNGKRVTPIWNGNDFTSKIAFNGSAHAADRQTPVLLTVGDVKPRKGQDVSLAGFRIVQREFPDAEYWIAGDDHPGSAFTRQLQESIQTEGLHGVRFLGMVSDEELQRCYRSASVFVLTPRQVGVNFEGFGLVYLEAGAYGLPVVASRSGGVSEAVKDCVTGLLADEGDVEGTAGAILRLLRDGGLRRRLGEANRLWAEELTWERAAKEQYRVYLEVLNP
jgi:O-antigen/teichoic acid export membrane protein